MFSTVEKKVLTTCANMQIWSRCQRRWKFTPPPSTYVSDAVWIALQGDKFFWVNDRHCEYYASCYSGGKIDIHATGHKRWKIELEVVDGNLPKMIRVRQEKYLAAGAMPHPTKAKVPIHARPNV
jgi:hypothetical protein